MARVKILLPQVFSFSCEIPVRISDINYGGHVGNDAILSIIHEARLQFLSYNGFTELNFGGTGMIMADAAIEFKGELFYGDTVIVRLAVDAITKIGFDLVYKLEKKETAENPSIQKKLIALAKTAMICYDYQKKKIVEIPAGPLAVLRS